MKISLNKNIKDSNKNFNNFEEKKGEFLKLTYKSFLTNEKRYNSNNMYIYQNIYNMIILYYYPILLIPLFCLVLIPNFDEFLDNLFKKILFVCPQNPYIEVTLLFIYIILFSTLPYLIILFI